MPVKISALPAGTPLTGAELIPMVQGGITVKQTVNAIGTFILSIAVSTATAGGVSNLVSRDTGGNSAFNNIVENILFVNALGFTTTLTLASPRIIIYNNNTTNSTLRVPDATTLVPFWTYDIYNYTTATISVQTNVGGAICTLASGEHVLVTCVGVSDAGGQWQFETYANVVTTTANQVLLSKNAFGQNVWSANTLAFLGNLSFGNSFTTSGNFAVTQTYTGITNVTFPTSGTLATTSQIPTGAALTKTDDTNVTLTLGGSPTTALINAASLTLGWTGQLAVTRGGTGLGSTNINRILYSSANNTISEIATANSAALITDASGVPSMTARTSVTDIGGFQKIQSKTAANNDPSVTFTTGLTNYSLLKINFFNVAALTGSSFLLLQVSTDGGSSYISTGYLSDILTTAHNTNVVGNTTNTTGFILCGGFTTTSTDTATGELTLSIPNSPTILTGKATLLNAASPFNIVSYGFIAQAPNAIRFVFTSGNFRGGTFIVSAIA